MNVSALPSPFRLAGLIAAHQGGAVDGRLRLQKTVYLLQAADVPLGYDFRMLHYGPYSEALRAEARILTNFGLATEEEEDTRVGTRYRLQAIGDAPALAPVVEQMGAAGKLRVLEAAETDILELAATYQYYLSLGYEPQDARRALQNKKPEKFSPAALDNALLLLNELGVRTE